MEDLGFLEATTCAAQIGQISVFLLFAPLVSVVA